MAEQRYIEAQQLAEQTLPLTKSQELLGLFIEIHLQQGISLPYEITLEFINASQDTHYCLGLIKQLSRSGIESQIIEIKLIAQLGELEELHQKITAFYLFLFERKIPRRLEEVISLRKQFFSSDFNLEIKELALSADRGWSLELEIEVKRLIREVFQRPNIKNKDERLVQLEKLLASLQFNNGLRIYGHLLNLYSQGIQSTSDYKKIIEMILYFEDFDFKIITLHLMDKLNLGDIARKYAELIKKGSDYHFVLLEKYFPHLKTYFITPRQRPLESKPLLEKIDLTLAERENETTTLEWRDESASSSDIELAEGLKHLEYEIPGWLNLAVGFIQSDFNKSAFFCAKKVRSLADNDEDFLKGSYLAVHALMKLQDYRLALDYCYEAIERVAMETDFLSFSYLEVEILIQLGERKSALKILSNIQSIDNTYRLSAKMLKRLNEI